MSAEPEREKSQVSRMSDLRKRKHIVNGELLATWEDRGDRIAKEKGYDGISGMEAVHRYLIDKHHWTLRDVRVLTTEDLQILFAGDSVGEIKFSQRKVKGPRGRSE